MIKIPECPLPILRGKDHLRNRGLISRVFFLGKMREYSETLFAREAEQLADALKGRERVDLESANAAGYEIGVYLEPLVDERRSRPKDDVISLMTQAELDGERLSNDDILGGVLRGAQALWVTL